MAAVVGDENTVLSTSPRPPLFRVPKMVRERETSVPLKAFVSVPQLPMLAFVLFSFLRVQQVPPSAAEALKFTVVRRVLSTLAMSVMLSVSGLAAAVLGAWSFVADVLRHWAAANRPRFMVRADLQRRMTEARNYEEYRVCRPVQRKKKERERKKKEKVKRGGEEEEGKKRSATEREEEGNFGA